MEPLRAEDPRKVGRYRLAARLGAGGMGQVFLGFSPAGRPVAVKVVHPGLASDPVFLGRFRHEAAAARKVSGAYTAPVVDAGDGDRPWLATALVIGPSLAEAVALNGPLDEVSVWRLAAGLGEALAEVHSCGLVHRDLKPSNVMLAADGPRLIDFGISRALDGTAVTGTGMIVGTPAFMSAEQATGGTAGPASDVFSFGSVLTFAATGAGPFGGESGAAVLYQVAHGEPALAGLPPALGDLVCHCLAKRPENRPPLAGVMETIAANVTPATSATSFWPEALAGVIESCHARFAPETVAWPSAPDSAESPAVPEEPGGLNGPADRHAPTGAAAAVSGDQDWPATITAQPSGPVPPDGFPPPASRPARRARRRFRPWPTAVAASVIIIAGAAGITAALLHGGGPPPPIRPSAVPAISREAAQRVLNAFTPAYNNATAIRSDSLLAAIETGTSYEKDAGANRWLRVSDPGHKKWVSVSLADEALYIPLQPAAAYPRWFAATITRTYPGTPGPMYVLFTQVSKGAPWKDTYEPVIQASPAPEIAVAKTGYAEQAPLSGSRLAIPPGQLPALTARALDGSAAAKITDPWAAGLADRLDQVFWKGYGLSAARAATDTDTHVAGPGEVFGLRTVGGGTVVFYSVTAQLTLGWPHGQPFHLKIPGYYTYATTQTSAKVGYIEQFAAYDPPHGTPSVIAETSNIAFRG